MIFYLHKHEVNYNNFVNEYPFANTRFRAFDKFDHIVNAINKLITIYDYQEEAEKALHKIKTFNTNLDTIYWLSAYSELDFKMSFNKEKYNEATQEYALKILEDEYLVDCREFKVSFEFSKQYEAFEKVK